MITLPTAVGHIRVQRDFPPALLSAFYDAKVGMTLLAPDNRRQHVNRAFCEFVGYDEAQLLSLTFHDIVHPEDAQEDIRQRALMLAGKKNSYRCEIRYLHQSGRVVWGDFHCTLVRTAEGEPLHFIAQVQDITDRRQAQQALERSEARLREVQVLNGIAVQVGNLGGWAYDVGANTVSCSPELSAILDLKPPFTPCPQQVLRWFTRPYRRRILAIVRATLQGGTPFDLEAQVLTQRGRHAWVRVICEAEWDAQGHVVRLHGALQDMSESKQALDALAESRRALATLLANLPGMAYRCLNRPDWPLDFASDGALGLTGHSPDQLVAGMPQYGDLIHEQDRDRVWNVVQQAVQERRQFQVSYRIHSVDGQKWVSEQGTPVFDATGELRCIEGFVNDMTTQKRAEQEAQRQEALLLSLVDSIPDAVAFKDLQGRYLGNNKAHAALLGRSQQEVRGRTCEELFPPALAAAIRKRDTEVLASLEMRTVEENVTLRDGRLVQVEAVVAPLRDQDGNPQGLVAISRDITERKKQEQEIRMAKEIAEDATRMKSDFLANMSHEIRTPMNAIIGLSHLVLKTALTERQRDYIGKVQTSGQHLLGVINDILDFSKVEAGKLDLENSDFELEKLLDDTGNLISEKAHAKGLEVVFNVTSDVPPYMVGDSLRLGQILLNYANNAVKFTEKGEICISVSASERTDKDVLLHFRVRDTGMGLTAEQMSRLFQSFSQADTSITRKFGGTGLGLAICKKLAALVGGEVGVESEVGKGSCFWFSARVGIGAGRQRELLPNPDLRGRRALVVDDNEHARAVIVDMLQGMTFVPDQVSCGISAVEQVRLAATQGRPYDIVYLDWRMPGMDGMETARQIKSLGLSTPPLFLMVTAHGREEVLREAEATGIANVLAKPVNASILFDTTIGALRGERLETRRIEPTAPDVDQRLTALRGARILLVEDNDINQLVARELLQDAGFVVEVAVNGRIALTMAQQAPYDLVFMDMQMPVMDGLEATRELRKLPQFANLPVVAMTANAMEQDRRRCIGVGMNDFVSKPLDPAELWAVLLRWLPPPASRPAAMAEPLVPPAVQPSAVRPSASAAGVTLPTGIDGLDTALGLSRMAGKPALYLAMLKRYVAGQKEVPAQIRAALAASDWATAERLAHTLKGVSGSMGAVTVQALAGDLETALRERACADRVDATLQAVADQLGPLIAALESRLTP